MTLDQYNSEIKAIVTELQETAQLVATQAMSGQAHAMNPEFMKVMNRQLALIQRVAKLNGEMLMGIMKK